MDELKVNIDLSPLTDEEIKQGNFGLKDLWMVQIKGKDPYGPYDTNSLKDYAHKFQFLFEDARVYNLEEDKWYEMFKLSQFQRRKPQLVSVQNFIKDQKFFILSSGQKDGPYSQDEMQSLLDKGHIIPSTQISLDEGKSWIKLYEYHAFDRRTKKSNQELPFKPAENILEKVKEKQKNALKFTDAQDALAELAFIGDNASNIELEKRINQNEHHVPESNTNSLKRSKKYSAKDITAKKSKGPVWKIAGAVFMVLIALGIFLGPNNNSISDIKPVAEIKTKTKSIDNSDRTIKKRSPASIDSSNKKRLDSRKKMRRFKKARQERRTTRTPVIKRPTNILESDIENIDINDPEIQNEISRQLASEYQDEEDQEESEYDQEEDMTDDYDNDASQGGSYDEYSDEDAIEHENY